MFDDFPLEKLLDTIDWTPFFITWELAGKFPAILEDKVVGAQATELYRDAQAMLQRILDEKLLTAKATVGFWPAAGSVRTTSRSMQTSRAAKSSPPCTTCDSNWRSPTASPITAWPTLSRPADSGAEDYIGGFCVTPVTGWKNWQRSLRRNTTTTAASC